MEELPLPGPPLFSAPGIPPGFYRQVRAVHANRAGQERQIFLLRRELISSMTGQIYIIDRALVSSFSGNILRLEILPVTDKLTFPVVVRIIYFLPDHK